MAKNAVIVCSKLALHELKERYKLHNRGILVVGDGDILDIGGKTLRFIETDIIKGTGMLDIQLPIRIRFAPNEEDLKNMERAVIYITDLLLSTI